MSKRKQPAGRGRMGARRARDATSTRAAMAAAMQQAGVPPAAIHAYRQTGRIVTQDGLMCEAEQDLGDWHAAVEAYRARERRSTPGARRGR